MYHVCDKNTLNTLYIIYQYRIRYNRNHTIYVQIGYY